MCFVVVGVFVLVFFVSFLGFFFFVGGDCLFVFWVFYRVTLTHSRFRAGMSFKHALIH